jgi:hypothetical protein
MPSARSVLFSVHGLLQRLLLCLFPRRETGGHVGRWHRRASVADVTRDARGGTVTPYLAPASTPGGGAARRATGGRRPPTHHGVRIPTVLSLMVRAPAPLLHLPYRTQRIDRLRLGLTRGAPPASSRIYHHSTRCMPRHASLPRGPGRLRPLVPRRAGYRLAVAPPVPPRSFTPPIARRRTARHASRPPRTARTEARHHPIRRPSSFGGRVGVAGRTVRSGPAERGGIGANERNEVAVDVVAVPGSQLTGAQASGAPRRRHPTL